MDTKQFVESRDRAYSSFNMLEISDHLLRFHKKELEAGDPAMMKGFFAMVISICKSIQHMDDVDMMSKHFAREWLKSHNFKGLMGEDI